MNPLWITGMICLLTSCSLQAQSPSMVSQGSPERAEVYDPPYKVPTELPADSALRKSLFELLHKEAPPEQRFSGSLKVYRNWGFFLGRTVDKQGRSAKNPPMDNDDAVALWLRTKHGWKLIDFSFGHSDAFFIMWPEKYGAPAELLAVKPKPPAADRP